MSRQRPKQHPKHYPEDHTLRIFTTILVTFALTLKICAPSALACVVVYHYKPPGKLYEDDCEGRTASASERVFLTDIRIAEEMVFPRAKLADLAWDSIIGHGGRLFHGWTLYQVFARCLTLIMENSTIPCDVYLGLYFHTLYSSPFGFVSISPSRKVLRG
jgi:hypothetical protein